MKSLREHMIPVWTEDLGSLQAATGDGARVYEKCSSCRTEAQVDLESLIADVGPRFTLWNFHPPCHRQDCSGALWFRAQPRNYFHVIMQGAPPPMVASLRERWRATLPPDIRDYLPLLPMLEATGRIAVASCGRCDVTMYAGLTNLRAWLGSCSMAEMEAKVRCSGGPKVCEIAVEMFPRGLVPAGDAAAL